MVTILATADWQAGVTTLPLEEQTSVWHAIADKAIERRVDLFLHGGDLYQGPVATMEQIAAIRSVFNRLREADIPIVLIRGNGVHDLAMRSVDALDLFRDYDGITVSDRPEAHVVAEVAVCTLPWVHPGRLLAQWNGEVDHDRVNEEAARLLVEIARDLLEAEVLYQNPDLPKVLLAHWAISGTSLPSGLSADEMREPVLPWADLDALGYELVVAGHLHHPQRIDNPELDRTVGLVPGSPQQLNFGETGEHGVWLVDLEPGRVEAEFVPVPSRPFVTIIWDPDMRSLRKADWHGLDNMHGAIVRVRYSATEEQARRFDHNEMRRVLTEAGAFRVKIEPEIVRERRARSERITEGLSPVEALEAYGESEGLPEGLRERMVATLREWSE